MHALHFHSILPRLVPVLLVTFFVGRQPCFAGQIVHTANAPAQSVPFTASVGLPRFDPSLGFLREVTIDVDGFVQGSLGAENTNSNPSDIGWIPYAVIVANYAAGGFSVFVNPAFENAYYVNLPAFDGTVDFAGSSGTTISFGPSAGTGAPSMTAHITGAALAAYTATSSSPGMFSINLNAFQQGGGAAPGIVTTLSLGASAHLRVTYDFDSAPARFCSGSPSFTTCPCGNDGASANGCGNSVNALGAALADIGQPSLTNDSFVLSATGMPDSSALFFQGDDFVYSGIPFGDGLLCVRGSIKRLGQKANAAGASQYPDAGDLPISVKGQITTPGARYYQTWYRNSAVFCTSATSNLTNALRVEWLP